MAEKTVETLKVHQAIARALADNGISTLFGLMGDANMYMADSFVRDYGGSYVAAAHEAGAALMALGYSSISGQVGVCTVTHGPAMTNTITALIEGVKGSTPMVLLCGDTPVADRENLQDVAQREFVIAAGAGFEQLRAPGTVAQDVAIALRRAIVERRPIALNVPIEFDWADVEYRPVRIHIPESRAIVPASDDLDNAIGIIAAAKRPIVLVGRGAMSALARTAILKLAERIEAPLATTLRSKDLFLGEDHNLGIFGTLSTPETVDVIMASDCIIAFGAGLNKLTTSNGTLVKGKRVVQVNLEPTEVGRRMLPDAGLVGDPAGMADIIVHWLDEAEIPASGFRREARGKSTQSDATDADPSGEDYDGTVDFRRALSRLDRILPADRVVVTDGGRFMREAWTAIKVPDPNSFLPAISCGSIGLGLAHAIGASFAATGRPTVLITGDGGFMHGGLIEFNTAVRHNCDLIVVVCNDGAYGAEHIKFRNRDMNPGLITFDWPDFAPLAIDLGGEGVTIQSEDDFANAEKAIQNRRRPLLIDVKLDPDRITRR